MAADAEQTLRSMGITPGPAAGASTALPAVQPRPERAPAQRITGKMLSYEQLVDALLLSPPGETQGQLAARLGYSQSWFSRIIASDGFQALLAKRIETSVEPDRREVFRLRFASIEEEARGILLASLNKLSARLADPAGVPDELVIRSAAMTSKLLGYGARQEQPAPTVNMHFHLEQLAQNVRNLNRAPINGECTPVPTGGTSAAPGALAGGTPAASESPLESKS